MDMFLAISQGIGVSLAVGFRPFLAALLVGVLAKANAGVDFEGTDFEFLESVGFLSAMLIGVAATTFYERPPRTVPIAATIVIAGVLGGLMFAGSMAADDRPLALGLAGVGFALLGLAAARAFIGGAVARLQAAGEQQSAAFVGLFGDLAALLTAALAVLVPPVAYLALGFCIWVLVSQRRRAARKYEGLRVLR